MCQFEENCTKIEGVRVPHRKTLKKPLWRHWSKIFKILEKCLLTFWLRWCCPSFIKNRTKIVAIRDPYRQTHTHTYIHTHRQGSSWTKIFSHTERTEYKKGIVILFGGGGMQRKESFYSVIEKSDVDITFACHKYRGLPVFTMFGSNLESFRTNELTLFYLRIKYQISMVIWIQLKIILIPWIN